MGVWELRQIPDITDDKLRLSRYPKMHPHILLPEYDYSIYIDAKVNITNQKLYDVFNNKMQKGVILSGIKHPERHCVYEEFFSVYHLRKETNLKLLKKEYKYIMRHQMPNNMGLYDACVILRKHNDKRIIFQNEMWWLMYNVFSKRDQLCYTFTLWSNNIQIDYLEGVSLYQPDSYCKITRHEGAWERKTKLEKLLRHLYFAYFYKLVAMFIPLFYYYLNH
jgi:hypothetical protein